MPCAPEHHKPFLGQTKRSKIYSASEERSCGLQRKNPAAKNLAAKNLAAKKLAASNLPKRKLAG
jgi:hypothetical protein